MLENTARLIKSGQAAVDNIPVWARAASCNQLKNEIVMSWVCCAMPGADIGMCRFGLSVVKPVLQVFWLSQSFVTTRTGPSSTAGL